MALVLTSLRLFLAFYGRINVGNHIITGVAALSTSIVLLTAICLALSS